ncbi:MAG TPA: hypothetical protein VNU97_01290 [Rhizomicrobium sp.]|jgi:hypothetical protein|nr:hypothetical protein [Rhizomicrobium sp.]
MKSPKKPRSRSSLSYIDGDAERFEARLRKNAKAREPRVPAMLASKGKRTKFTGMTAKGTVAALRAGAKKRK